MHSAEHLLKRLQKKGWSEEELQHARIIFSQQQLHHHIVHPLYDSLIHWLVFVATIISTIIVFLFLIPFVPFLPTWFSASIVFILALCLGLTFEVVIRNMTHLQRNHHIAYAICMPILCAATLLGMYLFLYDNITFSQPHVIAGIAYIVGFMAPYYIYKIHETTTQ